MGALPIDVAMTFVWIFLASLFVFVLVPLIISYWRLSRAGRHERHERSTFLQETLGLLAGLIVGDIIIFLLGVRIFPVPAYFLSAAIGAIDLFFLFFVADNAIVEWITRSRMRSPQHTISQTRESSE